MQRKAVAIAVTAMAFLIATAYLINSGTFWQTGKQWFVVCSRALEEEGRLASTVEEEVSRKLCLKEAINTFLAEGYRFSDLVNTQVFNEKHKAHILEHCPSTSSYLPRVAIDGVKVSGGIHFQDYFLPSKTLIARGLLTSHPKCPIAIEHANIP